MRIERGWWKPNLWHVITDCDVVCASDVGRWQRRPTLPCTCASHCTGTHIVYWHTTIYFSERTEKKLVWYRTYFPGIQPQTSELGNEFDLFFWFQSAAKKKKTAGSLLKQHILQPFSAVGVSRLEAKTFADKMQTNKAGISCQRLAKEETTPWTWPTDFQAPSCPLLLCPAVLPKVKVSGAGSQVCKQSFTSRSARVCPHQVSVQ